MSVSSAQSALGRAMDQQLYGATLITATLDRMNTGMVGMTPVINQDYAFQKAMLSAAYAEKGIGTRLDVMV